MTMLGLPAVACGVGVVWTLLWIGLTYTELDSDRESPVKMGFYLSSLTIGVWAILTLSVAGVGWAIWSVLA